MTTQEEARALLDAADAKGGGIMTLAAMLGRATPEVREACMGLLRADHMAAIQRFYAARGEPVPEPLTMEDVFPEAAMVVEYQEDKQVIPKEFDEAQWAEDHAAEQKRLLAETGGKEITITREKVRAAFERLRPEYEAWKSAQAAPEQPIPKDMEPEEPPPAEPKSKPKQ